MQRAQAVLHVRQTAGVASDAVEARAHQFQAALRSLSSVYAALALVGCPNEAIDLVVVDVDGLGDAEFEFFTLAPRLRPGCAVYAYSASGDRSRVAQACAAGTVREFADDSLTRVPLAEPEPPNRVPPPVTIARAAPAPAMIVPPPAPVAPVPAIELAPPRLRLVDEPGALELAAAAELEPTIPVDDGPAVDDELEDDEREGATEEPQQDELADHSDIEPQAGTDPRAVRVPWLRYPTSGGRTPPGTMPAGDNGSGAHRRAPASHEGRTPVPRESLLTEEELAALLEDDEPLTDAWTADNGARP